MLHVKTQLKEKKSVGFISVIINLNAPYNSFSPRYNLNLSV